MANARKGRIDPLFGVTYRTQFFLLNYQELPLEVEVGISIWPEKKLRPREFDKLLIVESFVQIIDVYGLEIKQQVKSCVSSPLRQPLPGEAPRLCVAGDKMPELPTCGSRRLIWRHQGISAVGVWEQSICGAGWDRGPFATGCSWRAPQLDRGCVRMAGFPPSYFDTERKQPPPCIAEATMGFCNGVIFFPAGTGKSGGLLRVSGPTQRGEGTCGEFSDNTKSRFRTFIPYIP